MFRSRRLTRSIEPSSDMHIVDVTLDESSRIDELIVNSYTLNHLHARNLSVR